MDDKTYNHKYYELNKNALNERRLFAYYSKKLGKSYVDDMMGKDNALDLIKQHNIKMNKLNKLTKNLEKLDLELKQLKLK